MKTINKIFKRKRKDKRVNNSLFSFGRFVLVFIMIGFVTTCSFLLFFQSTPIDTIHTSSAVKFKVLAILGNILFLCFIFSIANGILKKINFQRPIEKILDATHKITKGDFTARIIPPFTIFGKTEFTAIIEDFNKMAEELSTIETLKTDFISNVSHELKTPISVIQNYSVILQDPQLSKDERIEYAKALNDAAKNLSDLISSILKLNKLENQQMVLQCETYNLSEQLCQCLLAFEQEWEKKNLVIETDFDDDIMIYADGELLWHVWSNLISNAVKFSGDGDKISVSIFADKENVTVKISDTGCGMTEETAKHIFEKFYQGDLSRTTKGNGLGLTLVKRITDIMGGKISAESEIEKGSTFTVVLPLIQVNG